MHRLENTQFSLLHSTTFMHTCTPLCACFFHLPSLLSVYAERGATDAERGAINAERGAIDAGRGAINAFLFLLLAG